MAEIRTTHPVEAEMTLGTVRTKFFAVVGRILLGLAFLALLEAWLAPFVGGTILGMRHEPAVSI